MPTASAKVTITNELGLHLRPAMAFSEMASGHDCGVTVTRTGGPESEGGLASADGKSAMLLLQLVLTCGTEIEIAAEGEGAREAVDALVRLVESKFGLD